MTGISKCIHGVFEISALNITEMTKISENTYQYPSDQLRIEYLNSNEGTTVSTIHPNNFNIHKI